MSATPAEIARLRRMVAEIDDSNGYTDDVLEDAIERYPLIDAYDLEPVDDLWEPTYDLNAAAADVWGEKAGTLAAAYDFQADGATFSRSQASAAAARMQRHFAARRSPRMVSAVRA